MSQCVLVTWLGNTDLRASGNELGGELGPIGQVVRERDFDAVHLLTDHAPHQSQTYRTWLKERCRIKATLHTVSLSSPTRFDEIYETAVAVLDGLRGEANGSARFVYPSQSGHTGHGRGVDRTSQDYPPCGTHRVLCPRRCADRLLSIRPCGGNTSRTSTTTRLSASLKGCRRKPLSLGQSSIAVRQ